MLHSVEVKDVGRFRGEIRQLGHRGLHSEGHFKLRDPRLDFRIEAFPGQHAVQPLDFFHDLPLRALADALRIAHVVNRVALGLKLDAFEAGGQKAAGPLPGGNRLEAVFASRGEHHESRQILRLRAQAIQKPRAHAGPALDLRPGVHERMRGIVVDLLGAHRSHDA